jgi:hypothetical protein
MPRPAPSARIACDIGVAPESDLAPIEPQQAKLGNLSEFRLKRDCWGAAREPDTVNENGRAREELRPAFYRHGTDQRRSAHAIADP